MREYLIVLLVAAGVTWLLTPPVRLLALRAGAVTALRDRDVHASPTPRLGGLAMLAGVGAAVLVASRLPLLASTFASSDVVAVVAGAAVVCLVGAVDDVVDLDPLTKLAGQVVAAGVVVLLGAQLLLVVTPGSVVSLSSDLAVPLTVLVVLVTVNAINFVDGLDGLAAGVTAIAALAFFAYSYELLATEGVARADPATLLAAATAGACLGFLPHNHVPARLFMGDSGAMFLGVLLAGTTISATGRTGATQLAGGEAAPFLLPVLLPFAVLAVPGLDLLLAVLRRLRSGRSPFSPDRQHPAPPAARRRPHPRPRGLAAVGLGGAARLRRRGSRAAHDADPGPGDGGHPGGAGAARGPRERGAAAAPGPLRGPARPAPRRRGRAAGDRGARPVCDPVAVNSSAGGAGTPAAGPGHPRAGRPAGPARAAPTDDEPLRLAALGLGAALAFVPLAAAVGLLAAGGAGARGAALGAGVAVGVAVVTLGQALAGRRLSPSGFAAVLAAGFFVKAGVVLGLLALAGTVASASRPALAAAAVVGIVGALAVEAVFSLRSRAPYLDAPRTASGEAGGPAEQPGTVPPA